MREHSGVCMLMQENDGAQLRQAALELQQAIAEENAVERASRRRWEMYLSRSSHSPAMTALCPSCDHFLRWAPRKDDWEECERCDEVRACYCCNRFMCVTCTECHATVWFHRKLQQWICFHCNDFDGTLTRSVRNREGL